MNKGYDIFACNHRYIHFVFSFGLLTPTCQLLPTCYPAFCHYHGWFGQLIFLFYSFTMMLSSKSLVDISFQYLKVIPRGLLYQQSSYVHDNGAF